jgi:hypothetical protein
MFFAAVGSLDGEDEAEVGDEKGEEHQDDVFDWPESLRDQSHGTFHVGVITGQIAGRNEKDQTKDQLQVKGDDKTVGEEFIDPGVRVFFSQPPDGSDDQGNGYNQKGHTYNRMGSLEKIVAVKELQIHDLYPLL